MRPQENTERLIIRGDFDEDMYRLCYKWTSPKGRIVSREACMIHIDDIEGMFGAEIYRLAKHVEPGGMEWLPW